MCKKLKVARWRTKLLKDCKIFFPNNLDKEAPHKGVEDDKQDKQEHVFQGRDLEMEEFMK